ncbi:efflux RND transporter periplasmic adaptor subunit [Desulfogranum mediterraneum]|uniref:efflux RND transporter periplasmic adaptor subunit n=1 Tax=Desulfogranum mediterraneum TaxID=160661 RepID=UPI000403051F|nr:efflux RND transporter periplasmic adaptor subunit [Desulfogranum mediterraneum]
MNHYTRNWLNALCRQINGISRAVVFLETSENGKYTPSALFPEGLTDYQELVDVAKTALSEGKDIVLPKKDAGVNTGEPQDLIACPLFLKKKLYGVVVLQVTRRIPVKHQAIILFIQDSTVWLEAFLKEQGSGDNQQLVTLLELVASCLEHEHVQEAATDVVSELSDRLSCERASIGFLRGRSVKVVAVSHSAGFDQKSNLIRDIGEAMHEAMDQGCAISYPQSDDAVLVTRCHATLLDLYGIGASLTVPFVSHGKVSGAVLIERGTDDLFDQATREHLEHIVSIVGPVLEVRLRDEQWLPIRIAHACKHLMARILGPGHLALKFSLLSLCLVAATLFFVFGEFRVATNARLEALIQRVVVAPQDGYIAQTTVRAGDIIHSGDVLATLDDKDLNLENRRWSSQLEQLQTEYRDALAKHDRSRVSIVSARIRQAEAQLNLVNEKRARTRLTAPFDGLVVSGDLSQSLGSPVQRGQVLFTVAPLDAYRVMLKVDERDVGKVLKGQHGNLVLSGMPRQAFRFTVDKITPVSIAEEGRNFFQVEAKIEESSDLLRPGMEGVAKIDIDQRRLIWIVSHRFVNWLRMRFWAFWP